MIPVDSLAAVSRQRTIAEIERAQLWNDAVTLTPMLKLFAEVRFHEHSPSDHPNAKSPSGSSNGEKQCLRTLRRDASSPDSTSI
jgi:hypothetical protein